MLFNSYEFIFLFLPISLFIYFWLNKRRLVQGGKAWLVLSSLFFYSWWNIVYLPLILGSILFNFTIGSTLAQQVEGKRRIKGFSAKTFLVFGVVGNLALLGYFKYTDFFIINVNVIAGTHFDLLHIILPLGISFFTFTQIAYLVDAYRGEVKEMDYLNYTLFVTFFPHLLAGPILHHKEMMPQFDAIKSKVVNYKNLSMGVFLFSIGLFKKVVIADTFSIWANTGFESIQALTLFEAWATSLSYTLQLYFDFSGYTDMALGVALLFNIRLPINFNSPYKALDIQDFWRRWHITLSRFLRDYIYIPLGGNRQAGMRTYANLFTVFLIGGLWHGASWMFIIWGASHGIAIVIHRAWKQMNLSMNRLLAWFVTFNFINITWVFFRARDWEHASNIIDGMFGYHGIVISDKLIYKIGFFESIISNNHDLFGKLIFGSTSFSFIIAGIFFVLFFKNSNTLLKEFNPSYKVLGVVLIAVIYTLFQMSKVSEFLYFNF